MNATQLNACVLEERTSHGARVLMMALAIRANHKTAVVSAKKERVQADAKLSVNAFKQARAQLLELGYISQVTIRAEDDSTWVGYRLHIDKPHSFPALDLLSVFDTRASEIDSYLSENDAEPSENDSQASENDAPSSEKTSENDTAYKEEDKFKRYECLSERDAHATSVPEPPAGSVTVTQSTGQQVQNSDSFSGQKLVENIPAPPPPRPVAPRPAPMVPEVVQSAIREVTGVVDPGRAMLKIVEWWREQKDNYTPEEMAAEVRLRFSGKAWTMDGLPQPSQIPNWWERQKPAADRVRNSILRPRFTPEETADFEARCLARRKLNYPSVYANAN